MAFCGEEEPFPQICNTMYLCAFRRHSHSNLLDRSICSNKIPAEMGQQFNFWHRMSNRIGPCFKSAALRQILKICYQILNYQVKLNNGIRKVI